MREAEILEQMTYSCFTNYSELSLKKGTKNEILGGLLLRQWRRQKRHITSSVVFSQISWRLFELVKCRQTLLELISSELYPSSVREKKCNVIHIISVRPPENVKISIFTSYSSTVSRECTKKRDARAKLLVCKSNLLHFWRSRGRCCCDMLTSLLSKLFITQCTTKSSFDSCRIYMKEESLPHLSQQ